MRAWQILRHDVRLLSSALICLVSLGGFLIWAAFAPLAEGVIAFGKIVVEDNRQTIQHLEGGIIDQILVREGDLVEQGAPLLILFDVAAEVGREQILHNYIVQMASLDRLNALIDGTDAVRFSMPDSNFEIDPDVRSDIFERQAEMFDSQSRRLQADIDVLSTRRAGYVADVQNKSAELDEQTRSLEMLTADLEQKKSLLSENLISADRLMQLQRDLSIVQSNALRLVSERDQAINAMAQIDDQIIQSRAQFREQIAQELLRTRAEAADAAEQLKVAEDVVKRTTIHAPVSGKILNLAFSTVGGVVGRGQPILEIVPSESPLVASIEIQPIDRDGVYQGLDVQIRLSGLDSWRSPPIDGTVIDVSADLKTAPNGAYTYYEAKVLLSNPQILKHEIVASPGMPVEVFISSGRTRTLLSYLVEPISATLRRGGK